MYNKKKNIKNEFKKIQKSVNFANNIGLEVHAGHGITFSSAILLSKIKGIEEFNRFLKSSVPCKWHLFPCNSNLLKNLNVSFLKCR